MKRRHIPSCAMLLGFLIKKLLELALRNISGIELSKIESFVVLSLLFITCNEYLKAFYNDGD